MKRVAIIGCSGAGKSTLARALGQRTGLPVHHLDVMFWQPGWVESDRASFVKAQQAVTSDDQWIFDGNYGGTMDLRLSRADTIIWLDLPTLSCLLGVINRWWRYRSVPDDEHARPDMTRGNRERLTLEFLRYVVTWQRQHRPRLLARLADQPAEIIVLRSRRATEQFLATFSQP